MKTLIVVILILTAATSAFAETWDIRPLIPEAVPMQSVAMRTEFSGVAVGNDGVLRRTQWLANDTELKSLLWNTVRLPRQARLNDVALLPNDGFVAVGDSAGIWKADTDEGAPEQEFVFSNADLLCVAIHGDVVIIGGRNGALMKSTTGGSSFFASTFPTSDDVVDICVDGEGVWTAITSSEILRSTDGDNWISQSAGEGVDQYRVMAVQRPFIEDWIIYRLANPWMYQASTDGGTTWIDVLKNRNHLTLTYPTARALSMSVSDNSLQHSVMFMMPNGNGHKPFHYCSFDAGQTWYDLCTQFFSEFVGTSQAMTSDTTLICTGLGGTMLTFSRRGAPGQYRWNAPESVPIRFQPFASSKSGEGAIVTDDHSVLDASGDYTSATYSFQNESMDVRDVKTVGDNDIMVVDTTWAELVGVQVKTYNHTRLYMRRTGTHAWSQVYQHPDTTLSRYVSVYGDKTALVLPAGRKSLWFDDVSNGQPIVGEYPNEEHYNTTRGVALSETEGWSCVVRVGTSQQLSAYHTSDKGRTWVETTAPPFYPVDAEVSSNGTILISGYEVPQLLDLRILAARSTDQGASWTITMDDTLESTNFNYNPISITDGRVLYIAPEAVYVSDDDGISWRELTNISLGTEDYIRSGHWTSTTDVALYTKSGLVMTTTVDPPTSVQEGRSSSTKVKQEGNFLSLPGAPQQCVAYNLKGESLNLRLLTHGTDTHVDLRQLPRGFWGVRIRTTEGLFRWVGTR